MANLARTASQFFTSLLLMFVLTMTMYSYFRGIGSLCPSLDVGMFHNRAIGGPLLTMI